VKDQELDSGSEMVLVGILAGGTVFLALLALATVAMVLCCKRNQGDEIFPLLDRLVE